MFDKHTEKLTIEIHKLVAGAADGSYTRVRSGLEECLSADSEIAVPAYLEFENQKGTATPILHQKDGGFWYYIAYTSQLYVDASEAEFAVSIPFVNLLVLVGENRNNASIAGIIFNPDDDGGLIISLNEIDRLIGPVFDLLNAGESGTLLQ